MDNVAMITGAFPVLSQTFIVRQADALKIPVITNRFQKSLVKNFDLNTITVLDVGSNSKIFNAFNRVYRRLFYLVCNEPTFFWSRNEVRRAKKHFQALQVRKVLVQFGSHAIAISELCKELEIKLFVQFLGCDLSTYLNYPSYLRDIKLVLDYSTGIIVLNNNMRATLIDMGTCPSKIHINNLGVPVNQIKPSTFNPSKEFNFFFIGRLVPKKDPISLIKAFEICASQCNNTYLHVIGDGPLMKAVSKQLKTNIYSSRIKIYGSLNRKQIQDLLPLMHCYVQHSVCAPDRDKEGWPVAIAEAMAAGLPVVSTEHPGIIEQVTHGVNGFLASEKDYYSMAEYMIILANDKRKAYEMGKEGRRFIEVHGNIDTQINKLQKLISTS